MYTWIMENMGTLAVGAFVAAAVIAVIIRMVKNKKEGKSSCGCAESCGGVCTGCSMSGNCGLKAKKTDRDSGIRQQHF